MPAAAASRIAADAAFGGTAMNDAVAPVAVVIVAVVVGLLLYWLAIAPARG